MRHIKTKIFERLKFRSVYWSKDKFNFIMPKWIKCYERFNLITYGINHSLQIILICTGLLKSSPKSMGEIHRYLLKPEGNLFQMVKGTSVHNLAQIAAVAVMLPKLYAINLKMSTIKCKFYTIQTILPLYLQQKVMWRKCKGMVQQIRQMLNNW